MITLQLNPNPTKSHKKTTVGNVKISPNMSSVQGQYTYGIIARAASQARFGMGGQGTVVWGVPGSILEKTPFFDGISIKWDRLQKEDSEKVLRSILYQFDEAMTQKWTAWLDKIKPN